MKNFTPQYLARVFRLLLFKVIINTLNTQEENLTINFAQVNIFSGFASVVTFSWTLPRSPIFFLAMALVYRIVCLEISLVGRRSYTP